MHALLENPAWHRARIERKIQKILGSISGVFFAIALISLADGLIAQMRGGNNELNLVAGESITLSGPAALKNPVASDVRASFTPPDASLFFNLDGFFTGYWFGSGMWRGQAGASAETPTGTYRLRVSFRGAPKNSQTYILNVFSNAHEMRQASRSILQRAFGINPFIFACATGCCAIGAGIATYWFGRKYTLRLRDLGLAQIWIVNGAELCCLAPSGLAPRPGNARMVLDPNGILIGEARVTKWHKGKLFLTSLDENPPEPGALICLRHPDNADN